MAHRAALPTAAVTITPGYAWRLDLDVVFGKERPADWPEWTVRMLIWDQSLQIKLTNGAGVTFEPIAELPGATSAITIPVIRLSPGQTEAMRVADNLHYIIDLQAPGGEAEDYFAGPLSKAFGPPIGLLQ